MSTDPEYTSGSYFDRLQVQLELNVLSQFSGIMGNSSQNATQGVSPSISAVDTGIKAAMALSGALASGIESAYLPALEALGLSGMACLPISKQLDPVVGVDCHIMIPGGPLPNPYIGLLLNPKDFIAVAIASILPPPPPMPEEGASEGEGDEAKLLEMAHMAATMAIGMLGATVKLGNFLPRAVAGTPTRNVFHFPIGGAFAAPPMNKGHAFMGSLNVLADDDPLSGGRFSFSLYGTSSTRLAELMLNLSNKPFSGRILIYKEEGRLREMLFTEGYIVRYEEHYTQKRGGVLFINCTISARVIEIGDAYYSSMW